MSKDNELDLSPGCGTVYQSAIGNSKVTFVFSNNAEEATKARRRFGQILMERAGAPTGGVGALEDGRKERFA